MIIDYKIINALVVPPGSIIVLAVVGLLLHIKKAWLGVAFLGFTTALLIALSLPLTAHELISGLQIYPPLQIKDIDTHEPAAIVVLGANRYSDAPEYGEDTVNSAGLERLRYAAYLYQKTGLPILVSGGAPFNEKVPESDLMSNSLIEDFKVPVKWAESRSKDTSESARYSSDILKTAGVKHIFLVTHAWHMRRAVQLFAATGLKVDPAPMGFITLGAQDYGVLGYLPSANAFYLSSLALHEYIGHWWNRHHSDTAASPTSSPSAATTRATLPILQKILLSLGYSASVIPA